MTEAIAQPDKMAEVAGLAAAIADRILEQHEADIAIPPDQFRMLVRAARMLLDNGVPWPPVVERVIMDVAKRVEEAKSAAAQAVGGTGNDDVVVNLTPAFSAQHRS